MNKSSKTGTINLGLRLLFVPLALTTAINRGKLPRRMRYMDIGGFNGSLILAISGPGGGAWTLNLNQNGFRVLPGARPGTRATMRIGFDDFFRLLSGKLSTRVAEMTGRIRIEGEALAAVMIDTAIIQLRYLRRRRDITGWIGRVWSNAVMAASGTGYKFDER